MIRPRSNRVVIAALSLTLSSFLALTACGSDEAAPDKLCAPLGMQKSALMEIRESRFAIEDASDREAFAIGLLSCLAHPDPDLRDKLAYEGLVTYLRNESLSPDTIKILKDDLIKTLSSKRTDRGGFEKPFTALALAEIARVDRIKPRYTASERAELVKTAVNYMSNITDYRGFDSQSGWRHGVAHGADLLMQLAFNPNLTQAQKKQMVEAIETQIVPADNHFYIYDEPERLARPIMFLAAQQALTEEEWAAWFAALGDPSPLGNWGTAFASNAGLAKLHNTKAFAKEIYISAVNAQNEDMRALQGPALALLKTLP